MRENGTASDRPLDNVIVKRMQGFLHMNKLKKEALKVMAAGMSPEEIAGLRSLFQVRHCLRQRLSTYLEIDIGLTQVILHMSKLERDALTVMAIGISP